MRDPDHIETSEPEPNAKKKKINSFVLSLFVRKLFFDPITIEILNSQSKN